MCAVRMHGLLSHTGSLVHLVLALEQAQVLASNTVLKLCGDVTHLRLTRQPHTRVRARQRIIG